MDALPRRRALMACANDWESPFQVGSHHLARGLVRAGYDVAFLSDPISPLHCCRGWTADLRRRFASYRQGGVRDLDERIWAYVPAAVLTPHNWPILRSDLVLRSWHRWTWPKVAGLAAGHGFADVDLLYIDSMHQAFWLDAVRYRRSVYRVPDYNPHFVKYTAATRRAEHELARRVDLVVYPSPQLESYVRELGASRTLFLANGVDHSHFDSRDVPRPAEYRNLHGPIAVYVGVIPEWFHFAWVREAAQRLPHMAFVLIGPEALAKAHLAGLANVHLLGVRPYATIPGFLRHAHVGLMPFNLNANPRGVDVLQPQKLFAYFASGLPVVSADWKNLRELASPAHLCTTAAEFVEALKRATTTHQDSRALREYAAQFDWDHQVRYLLQCLDASAVEASRAA